MKRTAWMAGVLLLFGCGESKSPAPKPPEKPPAAVDARAAVVTEKAAESAGNLLDALKEDRVGSEVTVVGKVGDLMDGFAAFRIFDLSLADCYRDGKNCCDIPWDY